MLLQTVMFYWALLALVIVAACFYGLVSHNGPQPDQETLQNSQAAPKALFDFSGGREEGRQMQKALSEALTKSQTDDEFERRFRIVLRSATGNDMELTWAWLGRSLMEYRQANEFDPSPRVLAERFLHDIPRRYRL